MIKVTRQQRYNRSHPEVVSKALEKQQATYRSITLRFHKVDDAEIIQWLEAKDGTLQDAIKGAIYQSFQQEQSMTTTARQTTGKRSPLRLSQKQQQLLDDIRETSEGSTTAWVECNFEEWRSAQALARKGLIEIVSGRSGIMRTFEVRLTKQGQ